MSEPPRSLWFPAAVALLLLLGVAVRAPLLDVNARSYRLTEAFNTEEVENIRLSSGMLHKGTSNPHAFEYPTLFYYLSAAVESPIRALGGPSWPRYLIGVRALSLAFGLLTIVLVALIASRLGGAWAGIAAGAILVFDRTSIEISTLAKPNAAQTAFFAAGLLALVGLAARPRLQRAVLAAVCFALAAASKWIGGAGVLGIPVAAALGGEPGARAGLAGLFERVRGGLRARITVVQAFAPALAFGLVFLACVPYSLLSIREFGYGLGQVFLSQSEHRRALPAAISLLYLARSLGPVAVVACAVGAAWAIARVLRWDGSTRANGIVLVLGWAIAYGLVVTFVLARLPSYVDLWVPVLAVLAGCAWAGDESFVRRPGLRVAAVLAVVAGGAVLHGGHALSIRNQAERDTRMAAAQWLDAHARPDDVILADQSVFVPDRFRNVLWLWWGAPPRTIYDETRTWGEDPVWPDWPGGHRQLVFVNAKWSPPESLLARRPKWVVTSSYWVNDRAARGMGERYDRVLDDGAAGYARRAEFRGDPVPGGSWAVVAHAASAPAGALFGGPELVVYEDARPSPR